MRDDAVARIADAVLYEGYLLWPYRRGALKNQQRFTFGGVYPPAWDDRSSVQAEVLLEGQRPRVEVRLRFLHVVRRQVMAAETRAGALEPVDELQSAGEHWVSWDEALERESEPGPLHIEAGESLQAIPGGAIRRSWSQIDGELALSTRRLRAGLWRVRARVRNQSRWEGAERDQALRQTLCCAHLLLHAEGGSWVSATDPPDRLQAQARACENVGLWPVLVGEGGNGRSMLASAIILADYPEVAPESPGDLFDSAEIDQLLVLSILAMTDEERREMRDSDPRAREILERTQRLTEQQIMRLRGAIREFATGEARRSAGGRREDER